MWERSQAIGELDTPAEVLTLLHAGDAAILAALSDEDLVAIGLSEAAVSDAIATIGEGTDVDAVRGVWEACRAGNLKWVLLIADLAQLPEPWLHVVGTHWSTFNAYFDEGHLGSGAVGTRADTLLEILGLGATVSDHQQVVGEFASEIAQGKLGAGETGVFVASVALSSFAVGFLTGGAGVGLVSKAATTVGEQLTSVDDWTLELARRSFMASLIRDDDPERCARVVAAIDAEADRLRRAELTTSSAKKLRMLMSVHAQLTSNGATSAVAARSVPDLVGLRLCDARALLDTLALQTKTIDAMAPQSGDRIPFAESRWLIRGQWPVAGTGISDGVSVHLAFSRPDERIRMHEMHTRLRAASEPDLALAH